MGDMVYLIAPLGVVFGGAVLFFIYVNYIHLIDDVVEFNHVLTDFQPLGSISGQEVLKSPTTRVVGFICFHCNFISFCLMLLPRRFIHIKICYIFLEN